MSGGGLYYFDQTHALRTAAIRGLTKLTRKLLPQGFFRLSRAIALENPFGSLVGMALGGIIANAENHTRMERTFRRGVGRFQRITHGCTQIVGEAFNDNCKPLLVEMFAQSRWSAELSGAVRKTR
jgi:hypothetical protein